ncbi:MAG: hypothetical protein ACRC10_12540 [Thermoguttaceae bacterium]
MLRFRVFAFFAIFFLLCSEFAVFGESDVLAPGWINTFETDMPTWRLLNRENRTTVIKGERVSEDYHRGQQSEKWQFVFSKKPDSKVTDIFLGHTLDFPCLIQELSPSLWVRSDRAGLVLGVQIVLPHTYNAQTGRPFTFLIAGSKYNDVGRWEELNFNDQQGQSQLLKMAVQTANFLRAEFDLKLDTRDMYVRQLVLYVEGKPEQDGRPARVNVWIDDLRVDGNVPVGSVFPDHLERLEPEFSAFRSEIRRLEMLESQKPDSQESGSSKSRGDAQRIEIVGSLEHSSETLSPLEKRRATGFRPMFDPINMSGFLQCAVSEPVFREYSTPTEMGRTVWANSVLEGRNLKEPYLQMNGGGNYPNRIAKTAFDGSSDSRTGRSRETGVDQYRQMRLTDSDTFQQYLTENGGEATSSILYAGTEGALSDQRTKLRNIRIGGQAVRVRDPDRGLETAIGVRAIEYRGEPLALLHSLKFNAVWLSTPPSPELLEEAKQANIWLICPPPPSNGVGLSNTSFQNLPPTSTNYDSVLAWNLGDRLVQKDFQPTEQLARDLKSADNRARRNRPFVCSVDSGLVDFSRIPDMVIMTRREPLLTTLDLQDYGRWLTEYPKLALPSTPRWTAVQTQPDPKLVGQWDLFGGYQEQPIIVSFDQIRLLARLGLASGSHGILFLSSTPLTEDNVETKYRAKSLALLNMELMLIEEWFAEGLVETVVPSTNPQLSGVLLRRDRAKLLLPIWNESNSQYALGTAAAGAAAFRLPGVPETYDARLLTPGVLEPIKSERIAGGTWVELSDASLNSLIVLTESGTIRGTIEARASEFGEAMSQLALDLAEMRLESDEKTLKTLKQASDSKAIPVWSNDANPLVNVSEQETLLQGTRKDIQLAKDLLERRDYAHAYLQAEWATRGLRKAQREMWMYAVRPDVNRSMTPVSTCFSTIPAYVATFNDFRFAQLGQNQLLCGDFECNLETWSGVGWRHEQHRLKNVSANASLVPGNVLNGTRALYLSVQPVKEGETGTVVETAPIWLTTPGIPVNAGELLCVSGWINIPQKLTGSSDGLMIRDTIGGDALALRFDKTEGWREFAFYRYAPAEGIFETSFLLTGVGKVWIDDVSIRPVVFSTTAPPVPTQPENPTPRWNPFERLNPSLERLNPLQYIPGR